MFHLFPPTTLASFNIVTSKKKKNQIIINAFQKYLKWPKITFSETTGVHFSILIFPELPDLENIWYTSKAYIKKDIQIF